jgi:three-Cys-motif partner protein
MGLGPQSPQKFADFRGVVDIVVKRAMGALRKYPAWHRPYTWVDLTSGPGVDCFSDGNCLDGTPIIAMDKLRAVSASLGVPFEASFFEQHDQRCATLERELATRYGPQMPAGDDYEVIHGDSRQWLQQIISSRHLNGTLGAFVYDPTKQVDLDFLADIARSPNRSRYDLLVYVSASSIKRPRNLPARYQTDRRTLVERLQAIPKIKWIVRRPSGPSGWSWFIGTNDPKFPVWTQRGFFDIATPEGRAVINRMNLTEDEQNLRDHGGGLL